MHNNPHRNYAFVALSGAFGGAAALPLIQNLGKVILPALVSGLTAFWNSLTGGGVTVIIGECGMVNGDNNQGVTIYCDEVVNISEALTVAVEGKLISEWRQVIDNRLSLDIGSTSAISANSMNLLTYHLSQISKLTETSHAPTTGCFLPDMELDSDTSDWTFDAPELTMKPQLSEKLGTEHCERVSIPANGSHWCSMEDSIL